MVSANDLKERIEDHEEKLKSHDDRLRTLEINDAKSNEMLSNLEKNHEELKKEIKELNNTTLNTNNAILNSINQLIITRENNDTQKSISKNTNKTEIVKQFLVTLGAIVVGIAGYIKLS